MKNKGRAGNVPDEVREMIEQLLTVMESNNHLCKESLKSVLSLYCKTIALQNESQEIKARLNPSGIEYDPKGGINGVKARFFG